MSEDSKSYHDTLIKRSNEVYTGLAQRYGASSQAVLMNDQGRQYHRFWELLRFVSLDDPSATLLDVGCGNGELYRYLATIGYRGRYAGIDINRELLDVARQRFAGIDVGEHDIVNADIGQKYDYVLMSGLFNVDIGQDLAWIQQFAKRMFAHAGRATIWNAITTRVTRRDESMFYVDPVEMFRFCLEHLSRRVTVAHHNVAFNYTVAVYVEDEPHVVIQG